MIPLVSTESELKIMRELVDKVAKEIEIKNKIKLEYIVGTMIELPRAALQEKIYLNTQIFSASAPMI